MSTFADSSALVKLYADETGHAAVRALRTVVVSQLARVEVPAAIWRKQRIGELAADDAAVLVAEFEADYFGSADEPGRFVVVAATADVIDVAAGMVATHGLRASDAVQLATAAAARAVDDGCRSFAAFDAHLRAAAAQEAFRLVPAGEPVPRR